MSKDARTVFEAHKTTTLTFDCYGTLIDWESGACRALRDIYGYSRSEVDDDALIDLFLQADARVIRENIFPYSKVLQRIAQSVADSLRVRSDPALEASFASSLPTWPVFEETNPSLASLARRYRLAIISNVDDHLLSQTIKTQTRCPLTSKSGANDQPKLAFLFMSRLNNEESTGFHQRLMLSKLENTEKVYDEVNSRRGHRRIIRIRRDQFCKRRVHRSDDGVGHISKYGGAVVAGHHVSQVWNLR
jgi:hypothetical protein